MLVETARVQVQGEPKRVGCKTVEKPWLNSSAKNIRQARTCMYFDAMQAPDTTRKFHLRSAPRVPGPDELGQSKEPSVCNSE